MASIPPGAEATWVPWVPEVPEVPWVPKVLKVPKVPEVAEIPRLRFGDGGEVRPARSNFSDT